MDTFKDKVVVITGASSGIGEACAKEFAKKGAIVILAARNNEKLNMLTNSIKDGGNEAIAILTDVSKEDDCKKLIEKTIATYGKIDILVNNAGISMHANFMEASIAVLKELMDVNFWGTVYCTKYALPWLIKEKGYIVGVSSIAGFAPLPGRTGYVASKHAMNGFLNTIRVENIEKGLHVLVVHPGFTATNIRFTARDKNGNRKNETPRDESQMMTATQVAQSILKALLKKKNNIVLTKQGRLLAFLYKRWPSFAEKLIYKEMKKERRT